MTQSLTWQTLTQNVPLIGPIYAKKLIKMDIKTVGDLLQHLPFRYENYALVSPIDKIQEGETVTVIGTVETIRNVYTRNHKNFQKLALKDPSGTIEATWFNQPFITKALRPGVKMALAGNATRFGRKLQFESPQYELMRNDQPLLHCGRIVPVYSETAGITSKWLRARIAYLLNHEFIREFLPSSLRSSYKLPGLRQALLDVHFPDTEASVTPAKRRLAFDELFLLQITAQLRRREWNKTTFQQPCSVDMTSLQKFISTLPFGLTEAQKRVVQEIVHDLMSPHPMNRLLQGDVGSGKTVVAAIAMYLIHQNSYQSVLMAPTEILAEQHYRTLTDLLKPQGLQIGLQTGTVKHVSKRNTNPFAVLVGTHALIQNRIDLGKVKFLVIDEQHRFGVRQRAILRAKGITPHVLTMTATPIPRTVALTMHNDLSLSVLDEMPLGRKPVKTWVVPPHKRQAAYAWIDKQLTNSRGGQRAFIICPFIEPSESMQTIRAATQEYDKLKRDVYPHFHLGLLHGKMKSGEKANVLTKFRDGEYQILVATPVVEVGIDIPQATIILIEAADRFGLAQLHQLRGRVGRSNTQSYCLLFASSADTPDIRRLKYLERVSLGAELAIIDLKIRGPGQVFGMEQHGRDNLKIATYSDLDLIETAQREAQRLIDADPDLTQHPLLKERVISGTIKDITPD